MNDTTSSGPRCARSCRRSLQSKTNQTTISEHIPIYIYIYIHILYIYRNVYIYIYINEWIYIIRSTMRDEPPTEPTVEKETRQRLIYIYRIHIIGYMYKYRVSQTCCRSLQAVGNTTTMSEDMHIYTYICMHVNTCIYIYACKYMYKWMNLH